MMFSKRFFSQGSLLRLAQIQKPAPDFKATALVQKEFKQVSLQDYKGKWVLLFTYPLDFTFTCPTEIVAFSDRSKEFLKHNCQVIGSSIDSEYVHLAWVQMPRNKGGLGEIDIPLLADVNKKVARDYGALIEEKGIACRASFLIDPKGIVRHISMNDLSVGRSVDETLRLLQAFQYADKHGEVCPANWNQGGKTIKPDPKASQEYFKTIQ